MKFSQETTRFREYALWAGIILSAAIFILVALAIFDVCEMRGKVKDIQTFLGGLAVLAASLYSFYASSAAAAETFRKNSQDEETLNRNIRVNMILIAETLRQQSHVGLIDLNNHTNGYTLRQIHFQHFAGLVVTVPEQAASIWENIGIIPQNTQIQYLNLINFSNMAEQARTGGIELCKFLRDENANLLAKVEKILEKQAIEDHILDTANNLNIECNKIEWNRIAGLLANVNSSSIAFLKKMEESNQWQPDVPPYPPNFKPHEYTKPEIKN